MQRLQRLGHFARVGVYDLVGHKVLLKLRAESNAQVVFLNQARAATAEAVSAQARQANSCELALAVREALSPAPKEDAGGESPAGLGAAQP